VRLRNKIGIFNKKYLFGGAKNFNINFVSAQTTVSMDRLIHAFAAAAISMNSIQ